VRRKGATEGDPAGVDLSTSHGMLASKHWSNGARSSKYVQMGPILYVDEREREREREREKREREREKRKRRKRGREDEKNLGFVE